MEPSLRALVIDDHPVFRLGLVAQLRGLSAFGEVGEASDVASAREAWRAGGFSLVTLDLSLGGASGFTLLQEARTGSFGGAVLVVSMHDEDAYRARARAEGARDLVSKWRFRTTQTISSTCLTSGCCVTARRGPRRPTPFTARSPSANCRAGGIRP